MTISGDSLGTARSVWNCLWDSLPDARRCPTISFRALFVYRGGWLPPTTPSSPGTPGQPLLAAHCSPRINRQQLLIGLRELSGLGFLQALHNETA